MDSIEPDISIIVPARDNGTLTLSFLDSVHDALDFIQAEILVIDETGGRLAGQLSADHPEIMVYECSKNETLGQATNQALNQALRLATARYLSLWQPDTTLQPDCLRTLLNFLDDTPETGIVGPRVHAENGRILRSAGLFPSTFSLFRLLGLGTHQRIMPHPAEMFIFAPEFNKPAEVDWLMAGCLIIRRETIAEIGWPEPNFSPQFAALDLCRRSRLAGWHNHYVPTAAISKLALPELVASWPDSLRFILRKWRDLLFLRG